MAAPGSVVINFLARTADAVRDVDRLARKVGDVGDESKKADGKVGRLSGTMKAGLAAGAAVAGAGLAALGGFLIDAGKAALDDKKSMDNLANTLRSIPGVTQDAITANEDWISSMTLATSVADTDLRDAVGKLALATGDLTQAQQLTAVAADAAAGSGRNLSTITDALAKAHDGNTTALKRQFPWLDKNKDGTLTFAEAVTGLGDAYKGAAGKAAENDPWTRIATIWGELKESLGLWLIPLITRFGDWFKNPVNQRKIQDFIDKMGALATAVGDKLVGALEDLYDWLQDPKNQKSLQEFADDVADVARVVMGLVGALRTAVGWLQTFKKWVDAVDRFLGLGNPSGINWNNPPGRSAAGPVVATPAATTTTVNINVEGSTDPYTLARLLTRQLGDYAHVQGRAAGAPLAGAW